ncbi:MAG: YfhO family protein [Anaerolineales bacterium]|jgi:hypothetical protein
MSRETLVSKLPFLAILAAAMLLFWQILFAGQVIFWGVPLLQFYPWHFLARELLARGGLPLWDPYLGMGAPLLANSQSALLYPPNWLLLVLPLDHAQGWLLVAHIVLGGWGMICLARRLGINSFGQAVAGLAFALSGYSVGRAGFQSINAALAWLPWIILAAERLVSEERGITILLGVLLALQILAGHLQTAWYTWLLLAGWIVARSLDPRWNWGRRLKALVRLALGSALALLLSAAQLLPTLEYLIQSQRAGGINPTVGLAYSFWPWHLLTLLMPNFFGNPASGNYWGYGNYWEDAIYIGLLPCLLAGSALVEWWKRRRGSVAPTANLPHGFLALLLPLSLILALGQQSPVFLFLFRWVPTFNLFQAPARMMIWAVFALALLSGEGAMAWRRAQGRAAVWARRLLATSIAILLGCAAATELLQVRSTFIPSFFRLGLLGAAACLVWLLGVRREGDRAPAYDAWWHLPPAGSVVAILLICADLIWADYGLVPSTSSRLYSAPNPSAETLASELGGHRYYLFSQPLYQIMYEHFFRFATFQGTSDWMQVRESELPNLSLLDGIASANNFDPLVPARTAELLAETEKLEPEAQERLWAMMDVARVLDSSGWKEVSTDPKEAWGVCSAQVVPEGEQALQAVLATGFDPFREVILEVGKGVAPAQCVQPPVVKKIMRLGGDSVQLWINSQGTGYLVLSDTYYPGWQATLDGASVPILRADYAFRAVRIPPGDHMVEFRYRPLSFWGGALLSAVSLVALAALALRRRIRRRKTDHG